MISNHLLYGSAWLLYLLAGLWGARYLLFQRPRSLVTMQACLVAGLAMHTAWLVWRVTRGASWIPTTAHEVLIEMAWAVVLVGVVLGTRLGVPLLWVVWAWTAAVFVGAGGVLAHRANFPHGELHGVWVTLHASSVLLSYGAFLLACAGGLIYLVEERRIKQKRLVHLWPWLPSLDGLDEIQMRALVVGFAFLSVGLVAGWINAHQAWGTGWAWDAKQFGSVAMWVMYGAAVGLRWQAAWRGRKFAWLSVVGFSLVLFTCFGVNYLIPTQHVVF